ncbi:hypothetical protein [Cetobacterium ceti]
MIGFFKFLRGIIILGTLIYSLWIEVGLYKKLNIICKNNRDYKIKLEKELSNSFKIRGENFYKR